MRQTFARVDLGAFSHNIKAIRDVIGKDIKLMAVVKADAYGHGLIRIAQRAQTEGADFLGVALAEEGSALRSAGITLPILVLAGLSEESTDQAVRDELTLTVFTKAHLEAAQRAAKRRQTKARVNLKLDTGMNRIGVKTEAELRDLLNLIKTLDAVELSGAFTHFACADGETEDITREQLRRFKDFVSLLPDNLLLHASGSSALSRFPEARLNMVRAGISLYGYSPVPFQAELLPVMRFLAEITHIKTVHEGEFISYGATIRLQRETRVATLAVGYGDGYNRGLSNKADVLVNGKRCRVLGRVCMDQIMVDITDAGAVSLGQQAVLLGRDGGEEVSAAELADILGTIPYEVLLSISGRVPRQYQE